MAVYCGLRPQNIVLTTIFLVYNRCPTWGYPTEEAYYRDASSCDSLLNIRIPFLALQAKDDPVRSPS